MLDKHGPLDIPEVGSGVRQTRTTGYTGGGIGCKRGVSIPTNTDLWIYRYWDQVLYKHGPLDILEVGSGVRQTRTPGYTRGGIRCYTNTDHWIYRRWDQVLDKHGPLDIPEVGSDAHE
jgi:hypothetical protein